MEPLRGQLCWAPACKHNRVSLIVSETGVLTWDGSQVGPSLSFCFILCPCISFRQERYFYAFNWIFSLLTFQMLSPFLVSPLPETPYSILPPPISVRVFIHPLCSHLLSLNFSTLGTLSSLHKTKDLFSH